MTVDEARILTCNVRGVLFPGAVETLRSLAGAVDSTAALLIFLKHGGCFLPAEVTGDRDAPVLELRHPVFRFRPLIESDRFCIAGAGAAQQASDAGPGDGAVAHGARFTARHEFMCREACRTQIEAPDSLLGVGEGNHFCMRMRAMTGLDEIDADRYQPPVGTLEHGGAEGAAGSSRHIRRGQLDGKPHAAFFRQERGVPAPSQSDGPLWKPEGGGGRAARCHDGSELFIASKFFVTIASPFFVETSMPVTMTVRHSSSWFKVRSDCANAK